MLDANTVRALPPTQAFCIGIDSDGCVFDSMGIKHSECFCPAFINRFGLQAVARYARETWDHVNLYSKTRGCNRFPAVLRALELLAQRPEVRARGVTIPALPGLAAWVRTERRLGVPALAEAVRRTTDPDLQRALAWCEDVNAAVKLIVRDVPPFPLVRESLVRACTRADVVVVSQTPTEALEREWAEHDLRRFPRLIAGQELGTKAEHLALAAGGKYGADRVLMIGDAPGDEEAARTSGALFYPIIPGHEEDSWRRFHDEALDRFFAGTYAGAYARERSDAFAASLPERAPWQTIPL